MNKLIKLAILTIAITLSANFAWGQDGTSTSGSGGYGNNNGNLATVRLIVTANIPPDVYPTFVKASIIWFQGDQILKVEPLQTVWCNDNNSVTFDDFVVYGEPTHVEYCIKALDETKKPLKSKGGQFAIAQNFSYANYLEVTVAASPASCYLSDEIISEPPPPNGGM